jgi:ABC-type transport system involved in multi-copper enzyme maturation permease subunit
MRWGLGPVFISECLTNSRRWQTYVLRSFAVAALLVAMATRAGPGVVVSARDAGREYAWLVQTYFSAIIGVELALVMLAAPAATAGAICLDRARGTLAHVLVTDLSDAEIVLGKLTARLLPVLGLVGCSWPVLAISTLLGGIDPMALTLAFAVILAVALLGCTMALALSVWARRPHEVVLVVYSFWLIVFLLWPIWFGFAVGGALGSPSPWGLVPNPFDLAFACYAMPARDFFRHSLGFFVVTLGTSGVLILLAVWRMRPVACRSSSAARRGPQLGLLGRVTRWLPGPSLDGNPVLWREWHRSRPSRWMTGLLVLVGGSTGIACIIGADTIWRMGASPRSSNPGISAGLFGCLLQVLFGLLILSAVAPMSMSEKRHRGSLDLLAATRLSTRVIVLGKWLGTFRLILFWTLGPGLVGIALATARRIPPPVRPGFPPDFFKEMSRGALCYSVALLVATILVHGALLTSLGLAVAAWINRQSRAIAISVGLFVIVTVGWPLMIERSRMGPAGTFLVDLSPVMAAEHCVNLLMSRRAESPEILWSVSFWDVEVIVLSLGLLWLTVRTFDRCCDRIPERPRRTSVIADVVVVLAGLAGVGGLFCAIAIWINGFPGVNPRINHGLGLGVVGCCLLVTAGFLLLSALSPWSITTGWAPRTSALEPAAVIVNRRSFVVRWWEVFRLVLLLAIGPALIVLAQATARTPVRIVPRTTTLPGCATATIATEPSGRTYVTTVDASGTRSVRLATDEEITAAAPAVPSRSVASSPSTVLLAVVSVLAHGAMIVSLGLALGIWIKGRGKAVAASVGLFLLVTLTWPILYVIAGYPIYPRGLTLVSLFLALSFLLLNIPLHDVIEILWWIAYWDVILALLTVVFSGLAIRTLDRKFRGPSASRNEVQQDEPAGEMERLSGTGRSRPGRAAVNSQR